MKELSIEEKAKAYDRALEIAKAWCKLDNNDLSNDDLKTIFPELKESEDERIRKELIFYLRYQHSISENFEDIGKWIAWLEKQGEQKPFDYENADIQQKDFAPKETVKEAESNLTPLERKVKDILFSFHINAADGISFDGTMAIVHNLITLCQQEQKPADKIKPKFKVGDKVIGIVSDMQYYITDVCYDHYYTESGCIIMFCSQDNFKLVEQKPAWSEEDEKMVANLVDYFKVDDALQYTEKQVVDWLKSLKGRAQPQPKQEWSEEDQNALEDVREAVVHYWGGETQDILLYWLKSIKQRIKKEAV